MSDEKDMIRYILRYMLKYYFGSKTRMAKALNVELRTIQKAFAQLENHTSKGGSVILERILMYCVQRNISLDEMLNAYRQTQGAGMSVEQYVDFPCPCTLEEELVPIYLSANTYVQHVASSLCPYCKKECHPSQGDKWLWNDCMVSRISMTMLSQLLLVQENVKVQRKMV